MMEENIYKKISDEYGTPAYVFDLDVLAERVELINKKLGDKVRICYAMKANPFLVKKMRGLVDCFEVCSPGEFRICERAEIPMEEIVLSGVYKEKRDIERVLESYGGKGIYTVESFQQLELLAKSSKERKQKIHVLLRLTSGNQFGMDKELICDIIQKRNEYPSIQIKGIQFYSGTQKRKISQIETELQEIMELCCSLKEDFDFQVEELEYGPGLYIPYFQNESLSDEIKQLEDLGKVIEELSFAGNITLEMGRYIAATCGSFVTAIVDQKRNKEQNYCILDGGIHHLNYYGQTMAMKMPYVHHFQTQENGEEEKWNICGSLCTVSDVIVKQFPLKNAKIGDVIVFQRVGAYSVTEGISLFLSRDLPKVLFFSEDEGVQLVRDTLATDNINS